MPITLIIIAVTALVSFKGFKDPSLINKMVLSPYKVHNNKEWWRMFSSGIIHANTNHLLMNMLVMLFFGFSVEAKYTAEFGPVTGDLFYATLYVLGIGAASLKDTITKKDDYGYHALGASGATSAVLFAFILFEPFSTLLLYFVLPIPAILLGIGYLWYSSYMAKKNIDNIGHNAHFYGAIFGLVFTIFLKPEIGMRFLETVGNYITNFLN